MNDGGPLWPKIPDGPAPGFAYATLLQRAAATFVDYLIVVALVGVPYAVMGAGERTASPTLQTIGSLLVFVMFFAVFGATAAVWSGQTMGGRVLGLRIVKRSDGSNIGWVRALVRPIGVFLTVAFWFISLLAVVFGKEKRTPADALVGTVVITRVADASAPSESPIPS